MPDLAHDETERRLKELEQRIAKVYSQAEKELQTTIEEYFDRFKERDEKMKTLIGTIQNGKEWTENDYKQWRLNQMGRGERFIALRDKLARRMTEANEVAVSYVNDETPGIYSLNRNYSSYTIDAATGGGLSFHEDGSLNADCILFDEQTVKRLITEEPDLMPYYPAAKAVKRGIDLDYGKKQITSSITSGILQGKSIGKIANDLQTRIADMNRTSAVRTARTAMTGAQNAGRMDSCIAAEKMGIEVEKEWVATLDLYTRHSHSRLDGQTVPAGEPFVSILGSKMMFPGDSRNAKAADIYNCRCTMRTAEKEGIEAEPRMMRVRDPETGEDKLVQEMTYAEWAGWKEKEKVVETSQKPATIKKNTIDSGGSVVQTIGRIDIQKYSVVSSEIKTDEVIITDERINHIKERHPNDFERYSKYISTMLLSPQYILQDPVPNTAVVLQEFSEDNEHFRLILKLAVKEDDAHKKNSVITFLKISEKKFKKYLRNKIILYKSE